MLRALSKLPRKTKRALLIFVDATLLYSALWLAFFIRLEEWRPQALVDHWQALVWAPLIAIPAFYSMGLYHAVIRYIGPRFMVNIVKAMTAAALVLFAVVVMAQVKIVPRSVYVLYWVIGGALTGGVRMLARELLPISVAGRRQKTRVAVYGAGMAGAQTVKALQASSEYEPVFFIDDKPELHGLEILGCRVFPPQLLETLVDKREVKTIILSLPSAPLSRRREIMDRLAPLMKLRGLLVKTLPGLPTILDGKVRIDDIRPVEIEDLLGRDPVTPNQSLLKACIAGKSVMVTGAGGSIGSELCRQILGQNPLRLILVDSSEFALYEIEQSMRKLKSPTPLIPVLATALDQARMSRVIREHGVQTIYHAAAYKHVPIVEENPIEGARNNIFGAYRMARAALENRVETFILISTDKAVRPTSVMGATKRFAELTLQALDGSKTGSTRFTMVRFGNVLGSSGSVVPLFRQQIRAGGPVTVTHPDVTRYFMTIPEAAQLVIQAGSMGRGGDVFLLDMGKPVKIIDLAKKMIELSGLSVGEGDTSEGDIQIEMVGLRPGEKLKEELLIGGDAQPTEHSRIMRAEERSLPMAVIEQCLSGLDEALNACDEDRARRILRRAVSSFSPENAGAPTRPEPQANDATDAEPGTPLPRELRPATP